MILKSQDPAFQSIIRAIEQGCIELQLIYNSGSLTEDHAPDNVADNTEAADFADNSKPEIISDFQIVGINPAFAAIFGLPYQQFAKDIEGRKFSELKDQQYKGIFQQPFWYNLLSFPQKKSEVKQDVQIFQHSYKVQTIKTNDTVVFLFSQSIERTNFFSYLSHDIRTPMNVIMGMSDLLTEAHLNPEQRRYLEAFSNASQTLMDLFNDILDLSRLEADELQVENTTFDLQALICRKIDTFSSQAQKKNLSISAEFEKGMPQYMFGDEKRIRQVLVRLIENALYFTENGNIEIYTYRSKQPRSQGNVTEKDTKSNDPAYLNETIVIDIKDNRKNFIEKDLQELFTPFSQNSQTLRRAKTGMAICKGIVEKLNGSIEARIPGEGESGCCFSVTLPLREGKAADIGDDFLIFGQSTQVMQKEATVSNEAVDHLNGKDALHILLAEDSEDSVLLIQQYLKGTRHKLDIARNGREAIDAFSKDNYDLVLMDVEMPVLDGHEATRQIRKFESENKKPKTPVIALTAHALSGDDAISLASGCDQHVTKPIRKQTLLDIILRYSH